MASILDATPPSPGWRTPRVGVSLLSGNVGYIRIGSFESTHSDVRLMHAGMEEFRAVDVAGLIVDVRGTGVEKVGVSMWHALRQGARVDIRPSLIDPTVPAPCN